MTNGLHGSPFDSDSLGSPWGNNDEERGPGYRWTSTPPARRRSMGELHDEPDEESEEPPQRRNVPPRSLANVIDPATWRVLNDALKWQDKIGPQLSQLAATSRMFDTLDTVRQAMAPRFELPSLGVAEQLSSIVTGHSLLAGTLAAQLADARVVQLSGLSNAIAATSREQLVGLSQVSKLVERQSAVLAAFRPAIAIARPIVFATQAWESVTDITKLLDDRQLPRLQMTSRGTTGAIEAGLLLSEPDEETLERRRAEFSATRGPAEASMLLRTRLTEVHPDLLTRLDGAWERIHCGGADAASQAANSLMEALDWTLRLLSPDDHVLAWHADEGRPEKELHNGKPTRTLRARYAVRLQPEKQRAAELYIKSVQEFVTVIQSSKHSVETRSADTLASVALIVEGVLYFLIVD